MGHECRIRVILLSRHEANRYGKAKAKQLGITEDDVVRLIKEYRADEGVQHGKKRRKSGS